MNIGDISKIEINKLIYKSYAMSFDHFKKLLLLVIGFSLADILLDCGLDILYKDEYQWLMPGVNANSEVIMLSVAKVLLFSIFVILWARVISVRKVNWNMAYYIKIASFVGIWLVWHYVSFLGIYNLYHQNFEPVDLLVIVAGAYLPFVWVRFYSMLARLLDNQEIENLSEFLNLTKGQVIKICIALLFVVIPCSIMAWSFAIYYNGNILLGELILNSILLFFTSIWVNHCFEQNAMLTGDVALAENR